MAKDACNKNSSLHPTRCSPDAGHQQLPTECVGIFLLLAIKFLTLFFLHGCCFLVKFVCDVWIFDVLWFFDPCFFLNKLKNTYLWSYYSCLRLLTIYSFFWRAIYYLSLIRYSAYRSMGIGFLADFILLIFSSFFWASYCFHCSSISLFFYSISYLFIAYLCFRSYYRWAFLYYSSFFYCSFFSFHDPSLAFISACSFYLTRFIYSLYNFYLLSSLYKFSDFNSYTFFCSFKFLYYTISSFFYSVSFFHFMYLFMCYWICSVV